MKRYGNLFDQCFSIENLFQAYLIARKGKRKKRACFEFEKNLGVNLTKLREEILTDRYKPRPYFKFVVHEPKQRIIQAPAFRDVIVQHAIYKIIYPIFDQTFIDTNFACRKNKGTHKCADYVQQSMRQCSNDNYILHLDIKKFFYSIDHDILFELVKRKIKDFRLLKIIDLFIHYDKKIGIPIGNLLSQLFASVYLNPVDHWIKRTLKVQYYTRYVDDMVLIGLTFDQAKSFKYQIEKFIYQNLNLILSKFSIMLVKKGLNFVGYRTWRSRRFVRKHSIYKFNKVLKQNKITNLTSALACALNTSTFNYYLKRINKENPKLLSLSIVRKNNAHF